MSYDFRQGTVPLLVSMPHVGTEIPADMATRLTTAGRAMPDTDWHLPRLYNFLDELGASVLIARYSRYVIDLNRPPEGTNLYPGQDTTGLCPLDTFRKEPIYLPGAAPSPEEIVARRERYYRPYHECLAGELERLRETHGVAVLWDAHSIASELPRFFEGKLPDLNLGTADGASCAPELAQGVAELAAREARYTHVVNGRFKGGYITRHYGQPARNIHALQMEMSFSIYLNEQDHPTSPFAFREDLAAPLRPLLKRMLQSLVDWARTRGSRRA